MRAIMTVCDPVPQRETEHLLETAATALCSPIPNRQHTKTHTCFSRCKDTRYALLLIILTLIMKHFCLISTLILHAKEVIKLYGAIH